MNMTKNNEWTISILVPAVVPVATDLPPDEAENHSFNIASAFRRVTTVDAQTVQDQWNRTIDGLMKLSSTVAQKSQEWEIEEMEVGLTLSAKGELLFIAEAGAEASIKFTLRRKASTTSVSGKSETTAGE
jgi:hypothetical protein